MQLSINNIHLFYDLIEKYDIITIFRHISPDADALGSQWGLKYWIESQYPNKKVYAIGDEGSNYKNIFPMIEQIDEELIASSLAIVVDVSSINRIDHPSFMKAKEVLLIDHHMNPEAIFTNKIVYDHCGATSEIITLLIMARHHEINKKAAFMLYSGLIADTLRFSISATTASTLQAAAFLLTSGMDVEKANEANFSTSLQAFQYETYLRSKAIIVDNCFAYIIVDKNEYEAYQLSFAQAKEKVFVLGGINEIKGWALFTQNSEDENHEAIYNGSLRSRGVVITDIANKYHGGGHRYACGVKHLKKADINTLVQELINRIKQTE